MLVSVEVENDNPCFSVLAGSDQALHFHHIPSSIDGSNAMESAYHQHVVEAIGLSTQDDSFGYGLNCSTVSAPNSFNLDD